jgi:hypothetical protein
MSALVADGNGAIECKVEVGRNWLNVVRSNLREGDVIACFAEHRTGLIKKPLYQILKANFNATVYVLSGLYQPALSSPDWLSRVIAWAGSIGTILGFFWMQVKIDQLPKDWAHTALLCLSVVIEIGLIFWWNSQTTS